VLNGAVAPGAGVGANGDFYIDTATSTLYGPKAAGAWPAGVSLVGPAGTNGTNGTNGVDGRTVLNGAVAPGAGVGANGDFYIDTVTSTLYGPKAGGAWPAGVALIGANGTNGAAGADGRTVLNGVIAPGAGVGADGDFYIDTATSTLYGPKAAGAWPAGVSLVGPASASSVIIDPAASTRNVIQPTDPAVIPFTVKGAAAQTAVLQQWTNSTDGVLGSLSAAGDLTLTKPSASSNVLTVQANGTSSRSILALSESTGPRTWYVHKRNNDAAGLFPSGFRIAYDSNGNINSATNSLEISTAGQVHVPIKLGVAADTFGTLHKLLVNPCNTVDNAAAVQFSSPAVGTKPLVVQGFASQTANLQEWQDSAGTVMASVSASGTLQISNTIAANTPLVIRAAASQSSVLTEWRNSSNSTLLTISSTGFIRAPPGSVGAPVYSFEGDTNTGMYRPATDTLALVTTGIDRIRLYADGGVQVGGPYVTSPGAGTLQVAQFFRIGTPQSVSADATITSSRVKFTGSTAGQTLTLPAGASGLEIWIKNASSQTVTIARAGSDTIDGATTATITAGQKLILCYIGTDWTSF
jgi:hypothetical protein